MCYRSKIFIKKTHSFNIYSETTHITTVKLYIAKRILYKNIYCKNYFFIICINRVKFDELRKNKTNKISLQFNVSINYIFFLSKLFSLHSVSSIINVCHAIYLY